MLPPGVLYATEQDLAEYTGMVVEGDATRVLRRASELVYATQVSGYDHAHGVPTNEWVQWALRDATCAVIEHWWEVGETAIAGLPTGTPITVGKTTQLLPREVPPRAVRHLASVGLMDLNPWSPPSPFDYTNPANTRWSIRWNPYLGGGRR